MIQKISTACSKCIISWGNLQKINESVLRYGCELILTSITGLVILIILSLLIGYPFAWIFFVIGFAPQRTFAGGYHADTHIRCYSALSVMFLVGVATACNLLWNQYTSIVVSIISAVLVILLAPLPAVNKPLSTKRAKSNRIRSLSVAAANIIIAVFFAMINLGSREVNIYFSGVFFAATSLIIGKTKNYLKGGNTP